MFEVKIRFENEALNQKNIQQYHSIFISSQNEKVINTLFHSYLKVITVVLNLTR